MKNWNTTGKIKAVFIALYSLASLYISFVHDDTSFIPRSISNRSTFSLFVPLVFSSLAIPLLAKFFEKFQGREIIKPTWNDNPLALTQPLKLFHFCAYFFLATGFSMLIGVYIKSKNLDFTGLNAISYGMGILIGIELALKWKKANSNNN